MLDEEGGETLDTHGSLEGFGGVLHVKRAWNDPGWRYT